MSDEPCEPWPVDMSCYKGWDDDPTKWTPEQNNAVMIASTILWRLTAGRYGLCTEKVRPCRRPCAGDGYGTLPAWSYGDSGLLNPTIVDGQWINIACGCAGPCGCGPICEVALPGPVASVLEVKVDGQVVPNSTYMVQNGMWLVRMTGSDCWPECQDLALPDTEPGTWSVTYRRGVPVPVDGLRAAGAFAYEVWKACISDKTCRLPQRVSDVTREGVTYTIIDPQDYLSAGRTGLAEVDLWLMAVNPSAQRSPSGVWSPDLPTLRTEDL